ncbi:MAG: Rod shape-determining protein RodA [Planctomycetota bacterium]|jgi:rod shape determining protein RodA
MRLRRLIEPVLSLRQVRWGALDWHVLLLAGLLFVLGLGFVRAMGESDLLHERNDVDFGKHVLKALVALPFLIVGLSLRARWLARNAWLVYGGTLLLLVLVPLIGDSRNGARRWIALPGGFDLQPSELAKIGVILMLARVLYRNRLEKPRDWLPPIAVALVPMALVVKQPDLGTALSLVPVTLGMLYIAGARAGVLLRFLGAAAVLAFCVWHFQFGVHDYQLQRIRTWLESYSASDVIAGKSGPAFHSYHARVAIGNGGWVGQGMGEGVANTAGHLPERDCDSIFAVVGEEIGFVGILLALGVYALLVVSILGSASGLRDRFSRLFVAGVGLYFGAHLLIHTCVNLGLVPLTGIPLPLFSTGGSSMMSTMLALGLALGLAANREPSLDQDSFRS